MKSFDGSKKSIVGKGQNIAYWECNTPFIEEVKQKAIFFACQQALEYIDPLNYKCPEIIQDASEMSAEEWQEIRKKSIGSSEVAKIFGDSPYSTNLDLYYEKTGCEIVLEDSIVEKERKERLFLYGHLMEDYLHLITEQLFPNAKVVIDTNIYASPKQKYMTVNLDRMMQLEDGSWVHVEYKTASEFSESDWIDNQIPQHYKRQLIQCQHIMGVWVSYIIVLFSRDKYLVRKYERDLTAEYEQIQEVSKFWNNHIVKQIPPDPKGDATKLLHCHKKYHGNGNSSLPKKELGQNLLDVAQEIYEVSEQISVLNSEIKKLKALKEKLMLPIVEELGECCFGEIAIDENSIFEVKYTPTASRKSVDYEKLSLNYPEIYNSYVSVKTDGTRSFSLKLKNLKKKKSKKGAKEE